MVACFVNKGFVMSKKRLLIKGGTVVAEGVSRKADILVVDGKIATIGESLVADEQTEIFDAEGCIVTYGLADVHIHLREPGYSAK